MKIAFSNDSFHLFLPEAEQPIVQQAVFSLKVSTWSGGIQVLWISDQPKDNSALGILRDDECQSLEMVISLGWWAELYSEGDGDGLWKASQDSGVLGCGIEIH